MKALSLVIAGTLALILAGCSEEKPAEPPPPTEKTAPAEAPKAETPAPAEAPKAEAPAPAEAPKAEATAPAETTSSDVSDTAKSACLAAVTKETTVSDVAVLSSEFSEANSMVMVGVGPDRAPWKCLVSNDGVVSEVSSTVDEGAL